MKPQLANDANLATLPYPVWFQPKIDGVRALNLTGQLTGRSLDPFEGFGVTKYFSRPEFTSLDGEMTLGSNPRAEGLCSDTTGALGRFKGVTEMADFHWWLFDHVNDDSKHMAYEDRYYVLQGRLDVMPSELSERLHLVPFEIVHNMEEAAAAVDRALDENYEGGIFRNHRLPAKEGRPGVKTQELVRVKPWMDSEIRITGFREGSKNTNEAKTNSLGRTERSSSKAGLVPNGEIGTIIGHFLEDVIHPFNGRKLFEANVPFEFGTGKMTVKDAKYYFEHPDEFINRIAKVKHLAHGVKDRPRMGTFVSFRLPQDMSK
jgi:DNA ligase-1